MEGDAGAQARVLFQKLLHFVGIAGEDHHRASPGVLHLLDDGVDGLIAVETPAVCQGVGLVDEQDGAFGLPEGLLYQFGGPAHIFAH